MAILLLILYMQQLRLVFYLIDADFIMFTSVFNYFCQSFMFPVDRHKYLSVLCSRSEDKPRSGNRDLDLYSHRPLLADWHPYSSCHHITQGIYVCRYIYSYKVFKDCHGT